MATRTVVCPECDEPVPYGRLSCPNCGSLLASVAGAPRREAPLQAVAVAEPPTLVPDDDSNGHVAAATLEAPEARRAAAPTRARRSTTRAAQSAAAAATASSPEPEPAEPAVEPPPPADEVGSAAAPGDLDDAAEPAPPDVEAGRSPSPVSATAPAEPRWPGEAPAPTWTRPTPPVIHDWPPANAGTSLAGPVAAPPSPAAPVAWPAPPPTIPGLQPATTTSEVVAPPHARPALPPTPAGSWLPPTASFGPAQPNGATTGNGHLSAAPGTDQARTKPGRAAWLADLPFDAPDDLAGWLVTLGSAIAVVGFLLPWTTRMPFAAGEFGYTDRWGLAVPSHLLLLLVTLLLFVSSVRPTRIPGWLRAGIVPLVLGGLLLGIVWPFVIGGFGSQIGSLAVAMAAMVLVVGGGLAVRAERHGEPRSGV